MTPETVKKELPKLMKEFDVTSAYIAEKLGMSFYAVNSWVKGTRNPHLLVIPKLEQIFNGFRSAQERKDGGQNE